ncbi:MAG: glycosyltransferase family 4 protein [Ramlibacter sp.]|nr:glycosyltransferase family 4 protein [Ramlibacter sp.]
MKRILYVSDAASVHTRRWAEYFRDQGAEVHVASFRPAQIDGVEVHLLGSGRWGRLGYFLAIPRLRALARSLRPEVVHAQYVTSYGFLAAAAGLRPLVVTAWGTDVLISPRESTLLRWLASFAVRRADAVTTVAQHMNAAVAALGVPIDAVSAVPFGVDTQHFVPPSPARTEASPLRLICTRNFGPVYSVHTLVEALQLLRKRGLALQVDLVGEGPLRSELQSQVVRAGLDASVTFWGHVDHAQLAQLLAAAHLFVTPALSDGNNVSLNEAMACSCFPIATDIPANSQWIEPGVNGLLYPAGNAVCLADAIEQAARDVALRQRAAALNRHIVENRADWRVCVARMEETYRFAMVNAGQP